MKTVDRAAVDYVARGVALRVLAQGVSTIANINSFTSIAGTARVASTVNTIITTQFGTIAGKGGATYRRRGNSEAALPAWGKGVFWDQMLDGSQWIIAENYPETDMFGTVGDANRNDPSAPTGTDVTVLLNKITRYAETYGVRRIKLSVGRHLISDTILVGRGETYTSVTIYGDPCPWAGPNGSLMASGIITTKNDRPAFAIQGGRGSGVNNIAIHGPLYYTISNGSLGRGTAPLPTIDDRLQSAWLPGTGPHTNGRYNPGCGIALDPYAGVRPATSYPDAPYNAAYGESTVQYDRFVSSDTHCQDNYIDGFSVGVAIQPSDIDSNGDFIDLQRCTIQYCINGISVGQDQMRGMNTSDLKYALLHTVMIGDLHGRQTANLGGTHNNWSGGHMICLVSYAAGYNQPLAIDGYWEGAYRIANITGTGAGLHLTGGGSFSDEHAPRGRPLSHIGTSDTSSALSPVPITGRLSVNLPSLFIVLANSTDLQVQIVATERNGAVLDPWLAMAHNALAGGIAIPLLGAATRQDTNLRVVFSYYTVEAGTLVGPVVFQSNCWEAPSRLIGTPVYAKAARPTSHHLPVPFQGQPGLLGGTTSSIAANTRRVTLTYAGYGVHRERLCMAPGDVWYHSSGYWILVSSFVAGTVIGRIENGFAVDGSGNVTWPRGAPDFTTGTFYTRSGRGYVPSWPLTGDFTAGNAVIANVGTQQGAGPATNLVADVAIGDLFTVDGDGKGQYAQWMSDIASLDATAKTITLTTGNEAGKTGTAIRLLMRRAPMANVATP